MRVLTPILRQLILHPMRTLVVDDQRSWKAIHLLVGALHLAKKIEETTDRPHVGIMLPTSGMFPLAMIATWLLGRTAVPLNYLLKHDEIEYVIDNAELDTVITVGPMVQFTNGLPEHVKQIRLEDMKFKGVPRLRWPVSRPDDFVAVLLYTSGTSGKPKGVMLTNNNLASNIGQVVRWARFTRDSVLLGVLPQFHSFGLTVLTLLPLTIGCKVVYTARFVPRRMLDLLRDHRPMALIAIPSMFGALLNLKSAKAEDFSSLVYCVSGGEPLPEAVAGGFKERFGITINEGYGLTETSPCTNWCRPHEYRRKSVGKAITGVEERIVGPEGLVLGPNEDGEVQIRGPNIMKGYYKMPELTREAITEDGWFKTGDMGCFDPDGHLFITGRIKEMLIIGGENVFPREIEEVLDAHESVKASAVIGLMDESRGEVPVAFVELVEGAELNDTELRSHCRKFLAQYKVPRDIRRLEALPRNATGKIMRRELRAMAAG
jgi:long-chain acyl-CoA synthetase